MKSKTRQHNRSQVPYCVERLEILLETMENGTGYNKSLKSCKVTLAPKESFKEAVKKIAKDGDGFCQIYSS